MGWDGTAEARAIASGLVPFTVPCSLVVGEEDRAVLPIGGAHPAAELDEILVRVDHGALGCLALIVVAALVEGHPATAILAALTDLAPGEAGMVRVFVSVWRFRISAARSGTVFVSERPCELARRPRGEKTHS